MKKNLYFLITFLIIGYVFYLTHTLKEKVSKIEENIDLTKPKTSQLIRFSSQRTSQNH